jgi:hypothetical protein
MGPGLEALLASIAKRGADEISGSVSHRKPRGGSAGRLRCGGSAGRLRCGGRKRSSSLVG